MSAPGMAYQLAEAEWVRALAALDGDGGVALYDRKGRTAEDRAYEERVAAYDEAMEERECWT